MLCHREAAFSKRIGSETEIEVIGGADKYIAVCRECFYKGDTNQVAEKEKKRECVAQQALEDTPLSPNTEYSDNSDDNSNSSLEVSYFNSDIQRSFGIDNDDDTPLKNKVSLFLLSYWVLLLLFVSASICVYEFPPFLYINVISNVECFAGFSRCQGTVYKKIKVEYIFRVNMHNFWNVFTGFYFF